MLGSSRVKKQTLFPWGKTKRKSIYGVKMCVVVGLWLILTASVILPHYVM